MWLFDLFFFFSSILQIWYVAVRISQSISESPLGFELMRADCICAQRRNWTIITKTRLFKYIENYTTKNWKFSDKNSDSFFHITAQNIDCGYSLEPPRRGGSNEYPQSMFLSRNKKNNVYPCKPQFYYIKVRLKGSKLYRYVFVMNTEFNLLTGLNLHTDTERTDDTCFVISWTQ